MGQRQKTDRFWQLVGGTLRAPRKRQEGNEGPKCQNEIQKAKMKGNEGPKGENERK